MERPESLPVVVIACKVFRALLEQHLPDDLAAQVTYMDYGLHEAPSKLTLALQEAIDSLEEPCLVVLGYGLCGNGLHGIKARKHTLLVPRADDCIAILLGSREAYKREFESVPGTYYLTKGWLEAGSNPLQEYETYVEEYGSEKAQWIMDLQYQNYERLVLVAHSQAELETYRPQAKEIHQYCARWGMRYEEILGSDAYVRRLIEVAAVPDTADGGFLIVPPDGELRTDQFVG